MSILVTGGTGYIGSHTVVELLNDGADIIVLDNLSNSNKSVLDRIKTITDGKSVTFYKGDVLDRCILEKIFSTHSIESVIHFAGLKSVGESVSKPLKYYENNISGTLLLCEIMSNFGVKNFVFSSSATVYGDPSYLPITEDFPTKTTNPYGNSKLIVEGILADLYQADSSWNIARLRYFNPVGAHESGLIGEDPNGVPNNLLPYISQVAVGIREKVFVFGDDYDTLDGTGVRDYIHVVDLAIGHLKALDKLKLNSGLVTYNLGTGQGYSVLEMINAYKSICGVPIKYQVVERRTGDIASCYADSTLANMQLGWKAKRNITDMVTSSWKWQKQNPNGYND